ncbi:PEP-CTERM/exosortase system-associated acyltransferase [Massilia sp. MB5]|uniref:PEP-CTERM/exosortase system-associated acyltransferase n=1 Tax=unclassified Massilia TaxID=2609279 RepID=UPI0009E47094|nr:MULTISPECIES: PEP-CTERM/exosortase system-associated acyltransferase [unclassified Massilia]UMR32050.1 PEP-CTERM/exosortase system-associated acyltransferase [Massilia sp. MB5]
MMVQFGPKKPESALPLSREEYSALADGSAANHKIFRSFRGGALGGVPPEIFKLRYEVYCLEYAFLRPEAASDGLEQDEYEECSTHFAAYASDETLIGTVRLVQPERAQSYPLELHCHLFAGHEMPPRHLMAEISRLIVRKGHRRQRADSLYGVPGAERREHDSWLRNLGRRADDRESPMLLFGLYREMYRHSLASGIRYWLAAMERSLARSLQRMGFAFNAIGPQTDYYGAVTPYLLDLRRLELHLAQHNPALSAWFTEPAGNPHYRRHMPPLPE